MSTTGSGSIKAFKESSNDNEAIAEESEESEEEEAERLIATDHNVEPEVKRIPRLRKIIHVKRIAAVSVSEDKGCRILNFFFLEISPYKSSIS